MCTAGSEPRSASRHATRSLWSISGAGRVRSAGTDGDNASADGSWLHHGPQNRPYCARGSPVRRDSQQVGDGMSAPSQDPAQWLRDLMKAEPSALWPPVDIADTGKAVAAVAAPWTKAVADFTA